MLIGIGVDIVKIERIGSLLASAKIHRVFTEDEISEAPSGVTRCSYFAKRFAAKEACAKALGTGFVNVLQHTDIMIRKHASGQPYIVLSTSAASHFQQYYKGTVHFHLSLSDEKEYAIAFVSAYITP